MTNCPFPSGFCLLATNDDAQGIIEAQSYCRENGYSSDEVKIGRLNGQILVVVK